MAGNATELRATMAVIEADPRSWDQTYVIRRQECGTTMCFAGHTLARKGYVPSRDDDGINGFYGFYWIRPSDGKRVHAIEEAAVILELPSVPSVLFFTFAVDTPAKMREVVEAIIADDYSVIERYL